MKCNNIVYKTQHTKKNSRASDELDMALTTEHSFQTVYDNRDTSKRKSSSSVATPETEASSISYEKPCRRKSKNKSKRRAPQLMLCGALGEDEIVHDAKTSLRQIVTTLKGFGPDEKEAVREVLLESVSAIKGTLKKFAGQCSNPTS